MHGEVFGAKRKHLVYRSRKASVSLARKSCYKVGVYIRYSALARDLVSSEEICRRMSSAYSLKHGIVKSLRIYAYSRNSVVLYDLYLICVYRIGASRLDRIFLEERNVRIFFYLRKQNIKLLCAECRRCAASYIYSRKLKTARPYHFENSVDIDKKSLEVFGYHRKQSFRRKGYKRAVCASCRAKRNGDIKAAAIFRHLIYDLRLIYRNTCKKSRLFRAHQIFVSEYFSYLCGIVTLIIHLSCDL